MAKVRMKLRHTSRVKGAEGEPGDIVELDGDNGKYAKRWEADGAAFPVDAKGNWIKPAEATEDRETELRAPNKPPA